jgi:hypothetical protein
MPTSDGVTLPKITRLDDEILQITVYNADDTVRNISSDTIIFEARLKYSDATPVIRKTSESIAEIIKNDAANGKAKIYINGEDTAILTKPSTTTLQCSLEVIDPDDKNSSIMFKIPVRYRRVQAG